MLEHAARAPDRVANFEESFYTPVIEVKYALKAAVAARRALTHTTASAGSNERAVALRAARHLRAELVSKGGHVSSNISVFFNQNNMGKFPDAGDAQVDLLGMIWDAPFFRDMSSYTITCRKRLGGTQVFRFGDASTRVLKQSITSKHHVLGAVYLDRYTVLSMGLDPEDDEEDRLKVEEDANGDFYFDPVELAFLALTQEYELKPRDMQPEHNEAFDRCRLKRSSAAFPRFLVILLDNAPAPPESDALRGDQRAAKARGRPVLQSHGYELIGTTRFVNHIFAHWTALVREQDGAWMEVDDLRRQDYTSEQPARQGFERAPPAQDSSENHAVLLYQRQ